MDRREACGTVIEGTFPICPHCEKTDEIEKACPECGHCGRCGRNVFDEEPYMGHDGSKVPKTGPGSRCWNPNGL